MQSDGNMCQVNKKTRLAARTLPQQHKTFCFVAFPPFSTPARSAIPASHTCACTHPDKPFVFPGHSDIETPPSNLGPRRAEPEYEEKKKEKKKEHPSVPNEKCEKHVRLFAAASLPIGRLVRVFSRADPMSFVASAVAVAYPSLQK